MKTTTRARQEMNRVASETANRRAEAVHGPMPGGMMIGDPWHKTYTQALREEIARLEELPYWKKQLEK